MACVLSNPVEESFVGLVTEAGEGRRAVAPIATLLGNRFLKRFAVCYQTVVCPVCLSVTLVYCGQTVGRIKMKLGMQVGLGPGHIVVDGNPASPPPNGGGTPKFLAHIFCGQTAAWIKMPLVTEVGVGLRDIALDGDPAPLP